MRGYRRVLAFVTISRDAPEVVRRAVLLARLHGAQLALAAVVDIVPGLECDRLPVITGDELRRALAADVRSKLDGLLTGATGSGEVIVAIGPERGVVSETLRSWRPDVVVVSRRADHGMRARDGAGCDLLTVGGAREVESFADRVMNALASIL